MKASILLLLISITSLASANQNLQSTSTQAQVSPSLISHYSGKALTKTYVSAVGSLIRGDWATQEVYINIGYLEHDVTTYIVTVVGDILNIEIFDVENGAINVTITTDIGLYNSEDGSYEDGFTKHKLLVEADESNHTGYSLKGQLTKEVYFK